MASIRPVCHLKAPVFLDDMGRDRILSTAPFVRSQMRGPFATSLDTYARSPFHGSDRGSRPLPEDGKQTQPDGQHSLA